MNPIIPENTARLFTIGHSSRSLADFLELVREFRLEVLVDVRRYPRSKRHPHFDAANLTRALARMEIRYHHMPELGGYREPSNPAAHPALTEPMFKGYAEQMDTTEFAVALGRLQRRSLEARVATMCAESQPAQCHRNLLSDALVRDGFQVTHILAPGKTKDHQFSPLARLDGRADCL
ncbi:MAG: DUF488 domain-containing protein [Candidatus Eisenbacteria bacterium]|nr:DUF488 domain-containing protein [Candidatus Eisenbacteria bacterium]